MQGFTDPTELAEYASLGVRVNIDAGRGELAAALQPVARAAWGRVAGGADDLVAEAERARDALRLTVGAIAERRFLERVIAYAARASTDPSPGGHKIDATRG